MFSRTAFAAGDQGKAANHTTRNVYVLLLFFVSRVRGWSQWRDSKRADLGRSRDLRALLHACRHGPQFRRPALGLRQEGADLVHDLAKHRPMDREAAVIGVDLHRLVALVIPPARGAWSDDAVPPRP